MFLYGVPREWFEERLHARLMAFPVLGRTSGGDGELDGICTGGRHVLRRGSVSTFQHIPHPHTVQRLKGDAPPPPKVDDGRVGFNGRFGLLITSLVGTMVCAYVFAGVALISLPSAIRSHNLTILIAWISSNFIQLILLPIIIVGQNLQAKASDRRAEQTYKDAEAVLHEAIEIQKHLRAQDDVLARLGASGA